MTTKTDRLGARCRWLLAFRVNSAAAGYVLQATGPVHAGRRRTGVLVISAVRVDVAAARFTQDVTGSI